MSVTSRNLGLRPILFLVHRRTFGDPRSLLAGGLARNHTQVRRRLDLGLTRSFRRERKFSWPTPKCSSDIRYNDLNWPSPSDPPNEETLDPISLWQLGCPRRDRRNRTVGRSPAQPATCPSRWLFQSRGHPLVPCTANRIWRCGQKAHAHPGGSHVMLLQEDRYSMTITPNTDKRLIKTRPHWLEAGLACFLVIACGALVWASLWLDEKTGNADAQPTMAFSPSVQIAKPFADDSTCLKGCARRVP